MSFEDLNIPDDRKFFLSTITDLKLATSYSIQVRWKYSDSTFGPWSATKTFTTPIVTVPNDPSLPSSNVVGGAGFIKVTWDGNDASGNPLQNIDRVNVHISGTSFGDGTTPAGFFKDSGTQTFSADPGIYIVQLKAVTLNGSTSFFSTARTVTVTSAAEPIEAPTNPNGFSSRRILAGIEVSWAGTYSNGTFSGFEAIKIFAGTSASATPGTYTEVGVLTGNNVKNTIVVPVDGVYVSYGQPVYIHAAAVNKNGTVGTIQANVTNQSLGPGRATDADINDGAVVISKLASDVLTVGNLKAGDINSTSFIRAGTAGSARVEISSSTVGAVLPGLTVYDSSGTQLLRAPLTGGLTINGGGTFSGNLSAAGGTFTGTLSAASGSFSGTITASAGSISGITIASDALQNSGNTFRLDSGGKARFGSSSGNAVIIDPSAGVGSAYIYHSTNGGSSASGKFTVKTDGTLEATGVNVSGVITASSGSFTGSVTATSGSIGGWSIGSTTLSTSGISGAGGVRLNSDNNAVEFLYNSTGVGSIYTFNSGNEVIMQKGIPGFLRYPISTGYISLNSDGLSMGKSASDGLLQTGIFISTGSISMITGSGGITTSGGPIYTGTNTTTPTDNSEGVAITQGGTVNVRRNNSNPLNLNRYNVTVATTTSVPMIDFYRNGTARGTLEVFGNTSAPVLVGSSDYRLKENIRNFDGSLNKLLQTKVRIFNEIEDEDKNEIVGFVAHEFAEVFPNYVTGEKDAIDEDGNPVYQKLSYTNLVPYLVGAVQELSKRLDVLEG